MKEKILKTNLAPPGIYTHADSDTQIRVDWKPYEAVKTTGPHAIGEAIQMICTIMGAMVIALTLVVGIVSILFVLIPPSTAGEVTIEQAE